MLIFQMMHLSVKTNLKIMMKDKTSSSALLWFCVREVGHRPGVIQWDENDGIGMQPS